MAGQARCAGGHDQQWFPPYLLYPEHTLRGQHEMFLENWVCDQTNSFSVAPTVTLTDINGRVIARAAVEHGKAHLSCGDIAHGCYVLRISDGYRGEARPVLLAR